MVCEADAEWILARIAFLAGEKPTGKPLVRKMPCPMSEHEYARRVALLKRQAEEIERKTQRRKAS